MAHFFIYAVGASEKSEEVHAPFYFAQGAIESGHTFEIFLLGLAVLNMRDQIAVRRGYAPLGGDLAPMIKKLVASGARFIVEESYARANGVKDNDLQGKNAIWGTMKMFSELALKADKVIGF